MAVIGTAEVEVRSDSSRFAKDAEDQIKGAMGGVTDSVGKSAKLIGGALAGAFAVDRVVGFASSVVSAASDMGETLSKSKNVFGDQAAAIEEWASTSATSFGISKQAALAATAQYGDMFKQLGFTGQAAKDASTNLIKTAADLGSFHNVDPSDVLDRIGASLRGEFDSLQQLIPNLNAARVETEALAMTGKKAAKELTAQEKATATLAIIQKDGALAANDFAETSDGLANKQRILSAQIEDVKARLGEKLLPAMTAVATFVSDKMLPAFDSVGPAISKAKEAITGLFTQGVGEGGNDQAVTLLQRLGLGPEQMDSLNAVIQGAKAIVADFSAFFQKKFAEIKAYVDEIMPQVQEAFNHVLSVIQTLWDTFGDNIYQGIFNRMELIKGLIDAALEVIKGTISLALAVINGDWTKAWEAIKQIFQGVWDAIKAVLVFVLDEVKNILAAAWDVIKAAAQTAWDAFKKIISDVLDAAKKVVTDWTVLGAVTKHWDDIKKATTDAFDDVKTSISNAWDSVISTLKGLGGRISAATGGMWDGIKNAFKDAINAIIRGWNGLQFKTPSFDAGPIHYDGVTVGVPDIPLLAKGGVIRARSGGTAAIIGEGGSDEAVVPLNQGFVGMLVAAMKEAGVGGSGVSIASLVIQNNKTFQEQMDEIGRLDLPVVA